MSKQLGRISGPLLNANLLRDGTDLRFENQLLYLDVTNNTISINSTPINKALYVNDTLKTNDLIVDTGKVSVGTIDIGPDNIIRSTNSTITLSGTNYVQAHNIQTDNLEITGQSISTYTLDTDIEVRPTGILDIYANTNITGNLHSTGNISADGSVIFGNSNLDSVTFDSDINSSLLPNADVTYSLGQDGKQWNDIRVKTLTGQIIYTTGLFNNNLPVEVTAKNQWFVAMLGLDSNVGINESSAFATVAKALSVADPGDTVYIAPGVYTEIFPLTVPAGVTVNGAGVRSVTVQPTVATRFKDAFLLNGETAVSDLTVGNFYYDSGNNTGYGFRLASNCLVTTRSPYVQNVTVLNYKSEINFQNIIDGEYSTSAIVDILNGGNSAGIFADIIDGSNSGLGSPGRGSLVDGSVVNASSKEATILFNAVTMIIPESDGVTATNGARVEWLNSFTYFANRSLYATQGTLGFASLGVKFGAEIRAISSASVYGTYGAVADGADTLMYLIQYNFGYVGSGLNSSNDTTLVVQTNEVVELNSGKIYFQSVDQQGSNYRVGKEFVINVDNGTTSIDIASGAITGTSSLTIGQAPNQTFIDYSKIDVGNFTIRDNTILTKSQTFNIVSATGEINLTENVAVVKDLSVVGDVVIGGTITVGNQTTDNIDLTAYIDSDIFPNLTNTRSLGSNNLQWNNAYLQIIQEGNIRLENNKISTTITDSDLILSSVNAKIKTESELVIGQDLNILGHGYLETATIVGNATHVGNYLSNPGTIVTGDQLLAEDSRPLVTEDSEFVVVVMAPTGNRDITGNISVTGSTQISNIIISNNTIRDNFDNLNFTLLPGTGKLNIVSNGADFSIKNNRIINNKNDPIVFSTNGGYVQFAGTGAMAISAGVESDRSATAESGTLRVNTTSNRAEVYTQPTDTWTDVTGLGDIATREVVEEYGNLWILILG